MFNNSLFTIILLSAIIDVLTDNRKYLYTPDFCALFCTLIFSFPKLSCTPKKSNFAHLWWLNDIVPYILKGPQAKKINVSLMFCYLMKHLKIVIFKW